MSSLAVDPNPADNDSGPVTTPVTTLADVSVESTPWPTRWALDSFLYEIVVRNAGPSGAQIVNLVDTLDANVTFLGASNGWVTMAASMAAPCSTAWPVRGRLRQLRDRGARRRSGQRHPVDQHGSGEQRHRRSGG
ncbi:MAG: hypothetical protein R2873_06820 [Caldilineaceae bacterium]